MDLLERRQMLAVTPASDFTYTMANDQVAITGYTGAATTVEIPATINSLPVTSIGETAFLNRTSLTSVAIPSSVTSIGVGAFSQCFSLTSVTIPASVAVIGNSAFFYCTSLTTVRIPSSVTSIGDDAFYYCTSLTGVTISPGVTSIGKEAFSFCDSLVTLHLPSTVQHLGEYAVDGNALQGVYFYGDAPQVDPGALFAWDGATLYHLPGASGWTGQFYGASTAVFPDSMSPTAVTGIRGNGQVQLSWTAPVSIGGLSVTDYTVQYSSNNGVTWQTFSRAASTATSVTVTGLTNGTGYLFRVASVNDVGTGVYSANSVAVTPATTPGAPTSVTGVRGNRQVQVSWTAPVSNGGASVKDYTVQYSTDGSSWRTFSHVASTATSATVTGLTNGTGYLFRVASLNDVGTGLYSANSSVVTPAIVPDAPTAVSGIRGNRQVQVSWMAPVSSGGASVKDYAVQYSISGSSWQTFSHVASAATSVTVTGLTNGTAYLFRVAGVNDVGTGLYSANSSAVTPATTPGSPTTVSGIPGYGQVQLSWTAPVSNGGLMVTDYTVQYSIGGSSWQTFSHVASTATSATVTGLTNGTSYVFRVAARNLAGVGAFSASAAVFTPRIIPTSPTVVRGLATGGVVLLTWTAPESEGRSAITDYIIQYSSNNGRNWVAFNDGVSKEQVAIVRGLATNVGYVFRIAAKNAYGIGAYSDQTGSIKFRRERF